MKLLNLIIKFAQVYVAFKICIILYLINTDPKHHSINEVLWWISVLVLDMWINLIVFKSDTVIITTKEPVKQDE
jgi:hypothetical protein